MVRLSFTIALRYEIAGHPGDFVFNVHAARTPWQQVVSESLLLTPHAEYWLQADAALGNRYLRVHAAPGPLALRYEATVDVDHHVASPADLDELPIAKIPPEVLPFIYPSRYCQSDRLLRLAGREFGKVHPGYARVEAIRDWVRERTTFVVGSSSTTTSAADTLLEQAGVCRDFAHLMIALCRAVNIPARFVTGIDYGADPALGPPDFHAYVEVFLGSRWYVFDPTGISAPMGLVRIGTGRDAADVSFATLFGAITSHPPVISIVALDDPGRGFRLPGHSKLALSTSSNIDVACIAA